MQCHASIPCKTNSDCDFRAQDGPLIAPMLGQKSMQDQPFHMTAQKAIRRVKRDSVEPAGPTHNDSSHTD